MNDEKENEIMEENANSKEVNASNNTSEWNDQDQETSIFKQHKFDIDISTLSGFMESEANNLRANQELRGELNEVNQANQELKEELEEVKEVNPDISKANRGLAEANKDLFMARGNLLKENSEVTEELLKEQGKASKCHKDDTGMSGVEEDIDQDFVMDLEDKFFSYPPELHLKMTSEMGRNTNTFHVNIEWLAAQRGYIKRMDQHYSQKEKYLREKLEEAKEIRAKFEMLVTQLS